jgi:hypothetical protein
MLLLHHEPLERRSGRPESNGPLRGGAPALSLLSYIRVFEHARLESNQRRPPSQSSALPLSYERSKEPPAGVEPAPRPYKGRVLAVDTTEAWSGDGGTRTHIDLVASEALVRIELRPREMRTGGVEPPQPEGVGVTGRGAHRMLSVRMEKGAAGRIRTGTDEDHGLGCCRYTTATMTGTAGLEPATARLTSERSPSELRPQRSRGWDSNPRSRAHEAREDSRSSTAQRSGRQESNLRSPAPEAGGVATLPYDQMDQHPRRGSNPQPPG